MIRNIILILAALYSLKSWAELDYNFKGTLRTYPTGIAATSEVGYGYKLWGSGDVMYGYIRPGINIQKSGVVNYAGAQLDFFPVSFFGVSYGKTYGKKDHDDFSGFDCVELLCEHSVEKDILKVSLVLAVKKFKLLYFYNQQDFKNKTGFSFFAEEFSNLVGFQDAKLKTNVAVLGYDLSKDLMLGLLGMFNEIENSNTNLGSSLVNVGTNKSNMMMLIGNLKRKNISYQLGLGAFENRYDKTHFSGLFVVTWNGAKGLRLF